MLLGQRAAVHNDEDETCPPRRRSNSHHRAAFRLGAGFLVAFLGGGFRFVARLRFAIVGCTGVDLGSAVASAGGGGAGGDPRGGAVAGGGKNVEPASRCRWSWWSGSSSGVTITRKAGCSFRRQASCRSTRPSVVAG